MSVQVPKGYKQTDVGVIPEDWSITSLGDSMSLVNGYAFKPSDWGKLGLPIIRIQNLNDYEAEFNYFSGTADPRNVIAEGDLLFAWSGTKGTSFGARVWGGPTGVLNQHIFKVIPKNNISDAYAYLVLRKAQEDIEKQAHGFKASFVHVKKSDLVAVQLAFPKSLAEQQAIAEALSDADALIESLEQLIAKKRQIKQGAMQELLTGQRRLPGFGGEWKVKSLEAIADIDPEQLSSKTLPDYEFKYISLEDVDFGSLVSHSQQIFSLAPSRARRKLRKNDILVSTVRPNLKSHLWFQHDGVDWICSTGFSVIRCHEDIANPSYVFSHLFAENINKQIDALLTGSNYPAINSRDVRQLEIPLPEFDEQVAISQILNDLDLEVVALQSRLDKARQIKQAMMQELLTGRIRLI